MIIPSDDNLILILAQLNKHNILSCDFSVSGDIDILLNADFFFWKIFSLFQNGFIIFQNKSAQEY